MHEVVISGDPTGEEVPGGQLLGLHSMAPPGENWPAAHRMHCLPGETTPAGDALPWKQSVSKQTEAVDSEYFPAAHTAQSSPLEKVPAGQAKHAPLAFEPHENPEEQLAWTTHDKREQHRQRNKR